MNLSRSIKNRLYAVMRSAPLSTAKSDRFALSSADCLPVAPHRAWEVGLLASCKHGKMNKRNCLLYEHLLGLRDKIMIKLNRIKTAYKVPGLEVL